MRLKSPRCRLIMKLNGQLLAGSGAQGYFSKLKVAGSISLTSSLKETLKNLRRNLKGHLECALLLILDICELSPCLVCYKLSKWLCLGVVLSDWQSLGTFRQVQELEEASDQLSCLEPPYSALLARNTKWALAFCKAFDPYGKARIGRQHKQGLIKQDFKNLRSNINVISAWFCALWWTLWFYKIRRSQSLTFAILIIW